MENNLTVVSGGKMGDFIHSMVVCKYLHELYGCSIDLRIAETGDFFAFGVETAHADLNSLMMSQSYVNSFEILEEGEDCHFDLSTFRTAPNLYKVGWTDIFLETYLPYMKLRAPDLKIIEVDGGEKYKDTVVLHRKDLPINEFCLSVYRDAIENHDCVFLALDEQTYDVFPYRDEVMPVFVDDFLGLFQVLQSCKYYIGNLTAVTAAAHVLDTPRTVELLPYIGTPHYTEELKYYNTMSYMLDEHNHNMVAQRGLRI
jgi:hypothetical protein